MTMTFKITALLLSTFVSFLPAAMALGSPQGVKAIKGTGTFIMRERSGDPTESWGIEFEIAKSKERIGVKVDIVEATLEKRILIVTDMKSVYQSELLANLESPGSGKMSFATFDNGVMPTRLGGNGWWIPQMLALYAGSESGSK